MNITLNDDQLTDLIISLCSRIRVVEVYGERGEELGTYTQIKDGQWWRDLPIEHSRISNDSFEKETLS